GAPAAAALGWLADSSPVERGPQRGSRAGGPGCSQTFTTGCKALDIKSLIPDKIGMRRIQFAMVSILLGVAAPVAAQGASSSGAAFHVGFGASISTVTGQVAPVFLVPVDVGSHLRVEPEVGYMRTTNEQTIQTTPPTFPVPIPVPIVTNITSKQITAVPSIGTGVFFAQSREKVRLHYGARFGYARTSTEFTSVSRTTTAAQSP